MRARRSSNLREKCATREAFPLIFNGSDSENIAGLPILELTAPLAIGSDQY